MLVTSVHNACGLQLSCSVWSFRVQSSLGDVPRSGTVSRQVVCIVVYCTWCGCRESATCVLSAVSHVTCWLPFVCLLDFDRLCLDKPFRFSTVMYHCM